PVWLGFRGILGSYGMFKWWRRRELNRVAKPYAAI
ncbi:MAG: hypothetical protein ACI9ON_000202, partial [Limisphaerales bacterium]